MNDSRANLHVYDFYSTYFEGSFVIAGRNIKLTLTEVSCVCLKLGLDFPENTSVLERTIFVISFQSVKINTIKCDYIVRKYI